VQGGFAPSWLQQIGVGLYILSLAVNACLRASDGSAKSRSADMERCLIVDFGSAGMVHRSCDYLLNDTSLIRLSVLPHACE
jgi:hypothetical protein